MEEAQSGAVLLFLDDESGAKKTQIYRPLLRQSREASHAIRADPQIALVIEQA